VVKATLVSAIVIASSSYLSAQEVNVMRVDPLPTESHGLGRSVARGVGRINMCMPASTRSMLDKVSSMYGAVTVISAHRPGAVIAGTRRPSYHASCRAVDFNPARGTYGAVMQYLRNNWVGGLGSYSGHFHHIHIDTGPNVRFHKGSR